jgi:magnesium transporter
VSAIRYNAALLERMRHSAAKLGLTPEELELLDDITIENTECTKQAEIHSNVIAGLMDARVSIVNNNLSHLIKRLNFVMIALMWPTLACGIFSMNVKLPMEQQLATFPFWLIMGVAFGPVAVAYLLYLRRGKSS